MESTLNVVNAVLPQELALLTGAPLAALAPCNGDDCNSDSGGCDSDASCGQDC